MAGKKTTFNDLARIGIILDGVDLAQHGDTPVPPEVFRRLPVQSASHLYDVLGGASQAYRLGGAIVADVQTSLITFLWPNRFVQGNLNMIVGDPGVGKSYLTIDMAARVSRGAPWPDGGHAPKGNVLLVSGEDVVADTIRPRLEKHNADLSRIKVVDRVELAMGGESQIRLQDHMGALEDEVRRVRPRLFIVDPIAAFIGAKDDHRMTEIRSILTPLKQLSEEYDLTTVLVTHANKRGDQPPIHRVSGSIGYVAACRTVWMVGMDPDNESRRVFAPVKFNVLKDPSSLAFSILSAPGEQHGAVEWESTPFSSDPADLLAGREEQTPGAIAKALDFLREVLAEGPIPSRDLSERADRAHISSRTLKEARRRLGVEAVKLRNGWWTYWPGHGERPREQ